MSYDLIKFHGRKIDGQATEICSITSNLSYSECLDKIVEDQAQIFGKSREEILEGAIHAELPFIFELIGDGYAQHNTYRIISHDLVTVGLGKETFKFDERGKLSINYE
eukprot:Pompholyxophrys_sp_v1_NODE_3_length_18401_cov_4.332280.p14 type:complete len:108 gc:universal NODE_3_length_18401_cov_4.332280:99-422(+)